jgi:hypothetical protein
VPISLDSLPTDANGGIEGTWIFRLRQNLNGGHGGVEFREGRSVTPVDARTFKKFVATMGQDMVGAYRASDDYAIGDVSTLRPESYDELASKSLVEQSSNKLIPEVDPNALKTSSDEDPALQHLRTGAKFESPEKSERRKAFEKAAGREVKETGEGLTKNVTGEGTTPDGGKVVEGGEPALKDSGGTDPKRNALVEPGAPLDPHADTTSADATGKKKRW